MRYGVFCTPKPKKPVGHWMNDGDQDPDTWEGTLAEAKKQAAFHRKRHKDMTFEVRPIPDP